MKRIQLINTTIDVPQSWDEITVDKFVKMQSISKNINNEPDILLNIKVLASLIGCNYSVLLNEKKEVYELIMNELSFISTPPIHKKVEFVSINKTKYSFIEKLNHLTMGEMIDMEMIIKDSSDDDFLINILPLLIREVDLITPTNITLKPFDSLNYQSNKKIFSENTYITSVLFVVDFF